MAIVMILLEKQAAVFNPLFFHELCVVLDLKGTHFAHGECIYNKVEALVQMIRHIVWHKSQALVALLDPKRCFFLWAGLG